MSFIESDTGFQKNLSQVIGNIWYVDSVNGLDTNPGDRVELAFLTIGKAVTSCSAGDLIKICCGTFTEVGLDIDVNNIMLAFDKGCTIAPASGVGLTISGNGVKVEGELTVTPTSAIGVLVSGTECIVTKVKVLNGTHNFSVTGAGAVLENCAAGFPSAGNAGYNIEGSQARLINCATTGNTTSYGYLLTNSSDVGVLKGCTSTGHSTSGFYIDTGSQYWTIIGCSSGGGDGERVDLGSLNSWANLLPHQHEILFGGTVWYVDVTNGSDSNSGLHPTASFETIGKAITISSAGDAINLRAGSYDENGLDLDKDGLEIWAEIGAELIDTTTGTQTLLVSGNHCSIKGLHIDQAGQIGLKVTGSECWFENVIIQASTIGFDVDGNSTVFMTCASINHTVSGMDVSSSNNLMRTIALKDTGGMTRGLYLSSSGADNNTFNDVTTAGNGTAGFEIVTGCSGNSFLNCSSGSGDGKWSDADNTSIFSNFTFDNVVYKYITFTATGGVGASGTNYNLFKVTGTIKVFNIYGHVVTATPATSSDLNLELYSSNGTVDITATSDPDMQSRVVGTILSKQSYSGDPLEIGEPASTPAIIENTNFRDPEVPITLIKDDSADTFIQLVLSVALASGAMHWHVQWEPITDDGFLEPV